MVPRLTDIECRVLGCLVEKEITTPEHYPLTVNSLTSACNQKSNRSPVMDLSDQAVQATVNALKDKHLVWERHVVGARTLKYEHNLPGIARFSAAETAILCELLVRGPQTPGELRGRASRMHRFQSINEVEETLKNLCTRTDGPFIVELPRQPGTKENRYAHAFSDMPPAKDQPGPAIAAPMAVAPSPAPVLSDAPISAQPSITPGPAASPTPAGSDHEERIAALETEVALLRNELEQLKEKLAGVMG